jgi:hypothetical protein
MDEMLTQIISMGTGTTLEPRAPIWEGDMPGFLSVGALVIIRGFVGGRVFNVSVVINEKDNVGQIVHIRDLNS